MKYTEAVKRLQMFPDIKQSDLDKMPDEKCAICFEELNLASKRLYCKHYFHSTCLRGWLEQRQVCPVCNANVLDTPRIFLDAEPAETDDSEENNQPDDLDARIERAIAERRRVAHLPSSHPTEPSPSPATAPASPSTPASASPAVTTSSTPAAAAASERQTFLPPLSPARLTPTSPDSTIDDSNLSEAEREKQRIRLQRLRSLDRKEGESPLVSPAMTPPVVPIATSTTKTLSSLELESPEPASSKRAESMTPSSTPATQPSLALPSFQIPANTTSIPSPASMLPPVVGVPSGHVINQLVANAVTAASSGAQMHADIGINLGYIQPEQRTEVTNLHLHMYYASLIQSLLAVTQTMQPTHAEADGLPVYGLRDSVLRPQ